jgi:PhzF family phenazine biosynthesis protein
MAIPYYHVDSFTTALFFGNPAGVCILSTFPADAVMQQIARENRHSNTAFVVKRDDGEFNLRWFTPQIEDDLCGHATLAAAYVLALGSHDSWPVRFHTRSGVLTVARDGEGFEMDFPAWTLQACDPPAGLMPAMGLSSTEVLKSSRDYMVVLDSAEQVRDLSPDIRALGKLDIGFSGVIVTAAGQGNVDYVVRFFAPSVGIDEDPVTGSINCALAPYWSHRPGKRVLQVQQLSPRGGELRCTIAGNRVRVAGAARLYLHGVLELSSPGARRLS